MEIGILLLSFVNKKHAHAYREREKINFLKLIFELRATRKMRDIRDDATARPFSLFVSLIFYLKTYNISRYRYINRKIIINL